MPARTMGMAAIAMGVLIAAPDARAGDGDLPAGARVRFRAAGSGERVQGRLIGLEAERIVVETARGAAPVAVPYDQVARLQVSDGRHRRKAAVIGGLVGVAATGVLFATTPPDCSGSLCIPYFALVALPFGATGGLVGAAVAPERWRDVADPRPALRLSDRFDVGLRPARGGVGVAASVRF
jgi:hypothetical protein